MHSATHFLRWRGVRLVVLVGLGLRRVEQDRIPVFLLAVERVQSESSGKRARGAEEEKQLEGRLPTMHSIRLDCRLASPGKVVTSVRRSFNFSPTGPSPATLASLFLPLSCFSSSFTCRSRSPLRSFLPHDERVCLYRGLLAFEVRKVMNWLPARGRKEEEAIQIVGEEQECGATTTSSRGERNVVGGYGRGDTGL